MTDRGQVERGLPWVGVIALLVLLALVVWLLAGLITVRPSLRPSPLPAPIALELPPELALGRDSRAAPAELPPVRVEEPAPSAPAPNEAPRVVAAKGVRITGQVLSGSGQAAAGAHVTAGSDQQRERELLVATTGDDGTFTLDLPPEGKWSLQATAGGHLPSDRVRIEPGVFDFILVLGPGGSIHGEVSWSADLPEQEALMCLRQRDEESRAPGQPLAQVSVRRTGDGVSSYRFEGLLGGQYDVALEFTASGVVVSKSLELPPEESLRCDFGADELLLTTGTLAGWEPGLDASGAEPVWTGLPVERVQDGQLLPTGNVVSVQSGGSFAGVFPEPGDYLLRRPGRYPLPLRVRADGTTELPEEVWRGSVSGHVLRIDGGSPAAARIRLTRQGDELRDARSAMTVADGQGYYVLEGLPAGTYDLFADLPDAARGSRDDIVLGMDQILLDVDVDVRLGGSLSVFVTDASGNTLSPSFVWCQDLLGFFFELPQVRGRHLGEDMGVGTYRLLAGSPTAGLAWRRAVEVPAGREGKVTVALTGPAGCNPLHFVATRGGAPVPGTLVRIVAADGMTVPDITAPFQPAVGANLLGDDGTLTTAPYPAGAYKVEFLFPGQTEPEPPVEIVADGSGVRIDVVLHR